MSSLGYAVDLFDLILFTVVRIPSFADLHVADTVGVGALLLNLQSAGLILGGFLWGTLSDRLGRVRVLFGSIALYSVANLANGFVTDVTQYGILRFLSGVGLAGEFGIAVTLLSEVLPVGSRAYGTIFVTAVGVVGGLSAGLAASALGWRAAFMVGGGLGLALLVLRFRLRESPLFLRVKDERIPRGNLRAFFADGRRARNFLACVLIGVPNWFSGGILLTFAPELAQRAGATGTVSVATAVVLAYVGLGAGAALAGVLSERIGSRRWAIFSFMGAYALVVDLFLLPHGMPVAWYYALLFFSSFTTGYTALAVLVTSEIFGTNFRGTATTAMPNLVRGSVIFLTIALVALTPSMGLLNAALAVGTIVALLALLALRSIPETFGKSMAFVER